MELISCDYCGVVLDSDKLCFPDVYDHDTGEITEYAIFDEDSEVYVSIIECPVCDKEIKMR